MAKTRLPDFPRNAIWLNDNPLSVSRFRGQVVVLYFWDFTDIASTDMLPYLRAWQRRYEGLPLRIVSVLAPEHEFGHSYPIAQTAIESLQLPFPVLYDPSHRYWRRFERRAWPSVYVVDADGTIAYEEIGQFSFPVVEAVMHDLLGRLVGPDVPLPEPVEALRPVDEPGMPLWPVTPDFVTGFEGGALGNAEGYELHRVVEYSLPPREQMEPGKFYLGGKWLNQRHCVSVAKAETQTDAEVVVPYVAASVALIIHPAGEMGFSVEVTDNDKPMTRSCAGAHVRVEGRGRNAHSYLVVTDTKAYRVVERKSVRSGLLRLRTRSSGFALYGVSFLSSPYCDGQPPSPVVEDLITHRAAAKHSVLAPASPAAPPEAKPTDGPEEEAPDEPKKAARKSAKREKSAKKDTKAKRTDKAKSPEEEAPDEPKKAARKSAKREKPGKTTRKSAKAAKSAKVDETATRTAKANAKASARAKPTKTVSTAPKAGANASHTPEADALDQPEKATPKTTKTPKGTTRTAKATKPAASTPAAPDAGTKGTTKTAKATKGTAKSMKGTKGTKGTAKSTKGTKGAAKSTKGTKGTAKAAKTTKKAAKRAKSAKDDAKPKKTATKSAVASAGASKDEGTTKNAPRKTAKADSGVSDAPKLGKPAGEATKLDAEAAPGGLDNAKLEATSAGGHVEAGAPPSTAPSKRRTARKKAGTTASPKAKPRRAAGPSRPAAAKPVGNADETTDAQADVAAPSASATAGDDRASAPPASESRSTRPSARKTKGGAKRTSAKSTGKKNTRRTSKRPEREASVGDSATESASSTAATSEATGRAQDEPSVGAKRATSRSGSTTRVRRRRNAEQPQRANADFLRTASGKPAQVATARTAKTRRVSDEES